ncbi:putative hydrogen peroxide sensitive repressor [Streptomyces sp. Tu6071]|nr:putative hydrogen peroxide sensitive repressor [Streptomyces sp. Tu6071]
MRKVGFTDAGWSSSVARWAHNPEVAGSNPVPATTAEWAGDHRSPAHSAFSGARALAAFSGARALAAFSGARAVRAQAAVGDLHVGDRVAEALVGGEVLERVARRADVADGAAVRADQVLVRVVRVGVVALGTVVGRDLDDLTERDHLAERVVDGGARDLGEALRRPRVHLVSGQMNVVAVEHLGDHAALRRHAPTAPTKPFQKVTHRAKGNRRPA